MNAQQSIESLYKLFEKLQGPTEARELIDAITSNVITDIRDEGLPYTQAEFDRRVISHINDYLEVAKKLNVA
jgi:hypothetical protein